MNNDVVEIVLKDGKVAEVISNKRTWYIIVDKDADDFRIGFIDNPNPELIKHLEGDIDYPLDKT